MDHVFQMTINPIYQTINAPTEQIWIDVKSKDTEGTFWISISGSYCQVSLSDRTRKFAFGELQTRAVAFFLFTLKNQRALQANNIKTRKILVGSPYEKFMRLLVEAHFTLV